MSRVLDVTLAAVGLVVLSPLLLLAAVAVRCSGRGPVLFRQERVGRGGEPFVLLKFRTMVTAAGSSITVGADPRITRVGRWLRQSKVDELPQLVNVLRGEMALVGPRPELARYVEQWPPDVRAYVLSVRPGVTDPASIHFRHESQVLARVEDPEEFYVREIVPQKLSMYSDYIARRSVRTDLGILAETVTALFRRGD